MIKDIVDRNEETHANEREMSILRESFPACFHADGSFDLERFKEYLSDKVAVTHEGYELKFLGKNYARLLASVDTTTVIQPDEAHNTLPENVNSENIYISGDNLDGLKHLLKSYAGKVKCIYIDPPYNTGSDGFVYNDRFNYSVEELSVKLSIDETQASRILDLTKRESASDSAWLMFMQSRLQLSRDLLTEDGVIFISIDDNEQSNIKLLCDDIFGGVNFISNIVVQNNPRGRQSDRFFATSHEYLLCYAKNADNCSLNGRPLTEEEQLEFSLFDSNGHYRLLGLRQRGVASLREDRPDMFFPVYVNPTSLDISLEEINGWEMVVPKKSDGRDSRWMWGREKCVADRSLLVARKIDRRNEFDIFVKDYLERGNATRTRKYKTIWDDDYINNQVGTQEVKDLLEGDYMSFPKSRKYIQNICQIGSSSSDIVLDFFSGSATTAHAVMKLNAEDGGNRKFIMVQLPEVVAPNSEAANAGYATIDQIGMERIIRAAAKIREDYPDTTADLGFRHYTLVEPSEDTLDKLETFDQKAADFVVGNTLLEDFCKSTVLQTWLVRDGYGFTAPVEELDLAGYKGYYIDKHLYLIDRHLPNEAIEAIVSKYDTDGSFNPENVVLFGYSFAWTEMEALQINLKRLKDTEKNLRVNFDIRY